MAKHTHPRDEKTTVGRKVGKRRHPQTDVTVDDIPALLVMGLVLVLFILAVATSAGTAPWAGQ